MPYVKHDRIGYVMISPCVWKNLALLTPLEALQMSHYSVEFKLFVFEMQCCACICQFVETLLVFGGNFRLQNAYRCSCLTAHKLNLGALSLQKHSDVTMLTTAFCTFCTSNRSVLCHCGMQKCSSDSLHLCSSAHKWCWNHTVSILHYHIFLCVCSCIRSHLCDPPLL